MKSIILKRAIPGVVVLALAVLGIMWGYGYLGVKCGWIKPGDLKGMNAITRSGVDTAGGTMAVMKNAVGL